MAKPDTPGKRFNEFASQNYWGVESARKTITAVLYKGPYINIEKGIQNQVTKFIDNQDSEDFNINGTIVEDGNTYYVLHDRTMTSKVLTRLDKNKAINGDSADYEKFKAGAIEFFSDSLSPDIIKSVQSIYDKTSRSKIKEHTIGKIFQGIYAYQNTYRINDDVLFGTTFNQFKSNDLKGWSFVLNVPTARSSVAGRHDHVEFIKAKYLDDGPSSTSYVIKGQSKELLRAAEQVNSRRNASSALKILLPNSADRLEKSGLTESVEFRKIESE